MRTRLDIVLPFENVCICFCFQVLFLKVAPSSLLKLCLEYITKNKDLFNKEVKYMIDQTGSVRTTNCFLAKLLKGFNKS